MDFEAVSENIDIQRFLFTDLRVRYIGVSGDNYIIECPDPTHVDKHPSCYFHKKTLVYHCFGCGARGSIIDLVSYNKDIDRGEAVKLIQKHAGMALNSVSASFKGRYKLKDIPEVRLSSQYRRDWENARSEIQEFVTRRRFSIPLFESYFIGYNNLMGSITMPIIYHDKLINVGERFVLGDQITKIKYRKDVPLSLSIWGIFDGYNPVDPYFTEGIFDAVRMREAGLNAYALLSIVLPNTKIRFIQDHFEGVFTIVPDPDQGGRKMIDNWKKVMHTNEVRIMQPTKGDIDETPLDEIKELVHKTTRMQDYIFKGFRIKNEICGGIDAR